MPVKTKLRINKKTAGEIQTLKEINRRRNPQIRVIAANNSEVPWYQIAVGQSVFLPGRTCNRNDRDRRMRLFNVSGYSRNNSIVWTTRSTVENGVKGVRIYRTA